MFSGKSEKLIKQVRQLMDNSDKPVLNKTVLVLKCSLDHKIKDAKKCIISSRNGTWCDAWMIGPDHNFDADLDGMHVMIDEAQFLTPEQVEQLGRRIGCRITTFGLLADVYKSPFPGAAALVARADEISFLKATCAMCLQQSAVHNHLRVNVMNEEEPVNKSADGTPYVCENDDSKYSVLCPTCDKRLKSKVSKQCGKRARDYN
jgi:thymidine kinase